MQIREPHSQRLARTVNTKKRKKRIGFKSMLMLVVLVFGVVLLLQNKGSSQSIKLVNDIKSGWNGYCLDDYHNSQISNSQVDIWRCNGTAAQQWNLNLTQIKHQNLCLDAQNVSKIDLVKCDQSPSQVWLKDTTGYYNPASQSCLSAPSAGDGQLLILASCKNLGQPSKNWKSYLNYSNYTCSGSQGQIVACNAIKQWMIWQTETPPHEQLLTLYTGGAPYEEWCADFVSYIYKISNFPFSNGNYAGWDENIANQIQNQGFTIQYSSNYIPQPGDVGYFNYNGGHVEIVVSGGPHPTFIYGDSAQIDPTTNNGQMEANTILGVKGEGQLQYYLSPTSST
jgi:hypothetical protein